MAQKSSYKVQTFPSSRQGTFDAGYIGLRKHHIKALIELDVTRARELIRAYRRQRKEELSLTAWILSCIAMALSEHKTVHAMRCGKHRLVVFDDVDISIVVEKEVLGEKVPLPVVIRQVDKKSLREIHTEIKSAKMQEVQGEKNYVLGENRVSWGMKLYLALPQFVRLLIWRWILKNPPLMNQLAGTVVVTSIGMMGIVRGWVIPVSLHPICFALGSIVKKPGVFEGQVAIREYLHMTVLIDHDVVDGAPAARFVSRLTELIEGGFGLQSDRE